MRGFLVFFGTTSLMWGVPPALAQFRDVTPAETAKAIIPGTDPSASQELDAPEPVPAFEPITPPKTEPKQEILPSAEPETESPANPAHHDAAPPLPSDEPAESIPEVDESELAKLIESELVDDRDLRALKFRGVQVGETTEQEVFDKWGEPFKVVDGDGVRIIKYRMQPFRQVDVTVADHRVIGVLVHLVELQDPFHVAKELRMTSLNPVPIPDEFGNVMGMVYPERGVLLGFDARDPESLVSKIQIEPITPEPFVLRAEYDFDRRYSDNLADLEQAFALNPDYALAYWAKAKVCMAVGRQQDALKAIKSALKGAPQELPIQLTHAQILYSLARWDDAQAVAQRLCDQEDAPREIRAAAKNILGDVLTSQQPGKFNEAMQHHLKAIELAAPLANDARFDVRRLAKRTLVDAHLAVARDIALGDYQRQLEIVPKWLSRARALTEEFIRRDQGDRALRLKVQRVILATAADLRYPDSPQNVIDELLAEGHELIARAEDPRNRSRLQWELGIGLAEAVRLQRLRGKYDDAIDFAEEAVELLQTSARQRQANPESEYLVGRLYFHVGSLNAVHRKDHREAIAWYEKAKGILADSVPPPTLADLATHGEMFVSMGVSHWEIGNREQAIDLTETGTDILQKGVVDGILAPEVLAIPYGNLASMHQQAGNAQDAKAFNELSKAIERGEGIRKR